MSNLKMYCGNTLQMISYLKYVVSNCKKKSFPHVIKYVLASASMNTISFMSNIYHLCHKFLKPCVKFHFFDFISPLWSISSMKLCFPHGNFYSYDCFQAYIANHVCCKFHPCTIQSICPNNYILSWKRSSSRRKPRVHFYDQFLSVINFIYEQCFIPRWYTTLMHSIFHSCFFFINPKCQISYILQKKLFFNFLF